MNEYFDWLTVQHQKMPVQGTTVTFGDINRFGNRIDMLLSGPGGAFTFLGVTIHCEPGGVEPLLQTLEQNHIRYTVVDDTTIEVREQAKAATTARSSWDAPGKSL